MGEIQGNGPTTADYAYAQAREVNDRLKRLEAAKAEADSAWTGRPTAKADGDGVLLEVASHCVSTDLTRQEAIDLAVDLIAAATGHEAVMHDGEYLIDLPNGAKVPTKYIMFLPVDYVAKGFPPEARAAYLKSRGR